MSPSLGRIASGCVLVFLLTSCTSIGPRAIHVNRGLYNDVVLETENEQLLKNIVRLRYSEPTFFLKLTNVTTSYNLSSSITTNPSLLYITGHENGFSQTLRTGSVNLNPSLSYSDTPTISYQPIENKDFVRALMTPLTIDELRMLYAGKIHDFVYLSRLVMESIGDIENAASATSRKIVEVPEYQDFYDILDLIAQLRRQKIMHLGVAKFNEHHEIVFRFRNARAATSPGAIKLKRILNVPLNSDSIFLTDIYNYCGDMDLNQALLSTKVAVYDGTCAPAKVVHMEFRSVLEIMRALSFSVRIPPEDIQAGYVDQLRYPDGRLFNWQLLEKGMMTIYSSNSEPYDTFVKTYVHQHWFYIKNSDVDSKITLAFLQRLMTLVAGGSAEANADGGPILTIPVN